MSNSNIFSFRMGDATAYLAFYIVIPITVTYISLKVLSPDVVSGAYCYMTILVSVLNGIYDAANRWNGGMKCKRNTKLFVICMSNAIIVVYCLYIIFSVLIMHKVEGRMDAVLLAYLGTCFIAIWDIMATFLRDMSLTEKVEDHRIGGASE